MRCLVHLRGRQRREIERLTCIGLSAAVTCKQPIQRMQLVGDRIESTIDVADDVLDQLALGSECLGKTATIQKIN